MNLQHIYLTKRNKTLAAIDHSQITTIEQESTGWSVRLLNRRSRVFVEESREEILNKINEAICYKELKLQRILNQSEQKKQATIEAYEECQKQALQAEKNTPKLPIPHFPSKNKKGPKSNEE